MKKNKLKELIEFVGLSYKKEMLKIALINAGMLIAMVCIFIFLKNLIFLVLLFIGTMLLNFFSLTRYSDKKKMILKNDLPGIFLKKKYDKTSESRIKRISLRPNTTLS